MLKNAPPRLLTNRTRQWLRNFIAFMAPTHIGSSFSEKMNATLGSFLGILTVGIISHLWAPPHSAWLMTASMGASAVLLFAAPHAPMSQPWPVLGGHLISGLTGIIGSLYLSDHLNPYLLIALVTSGSILFMYLLGCLHPPGAATALTVLFSGESQGIYTISYEFLLFPVLTNVFLLLLIAFVFHSLSKKHYPAYYAEQDLDLYDLPTYELHHEFLQALSKIDSFVDINEQELHRVFELAKIHQTPEPINPQTLKVGACYSNGSLGKNWAVREIMELVEDDSEEEYVIFKLKAGQEKTKTDCITRKEFTEWASCEVEPAVSGWQKKIPETDSETKIPPPA